MAFITADRVKDTSTTTGTGNITVSGSAPFGYRTFSTVLSVGDTFYYCIQGQASAEWEIGIGTYASTNQFARTTVLSSSASGSAVSFSSGTKNVFITLAASKTLQLGPSDGPTAGSVPYGTGSTLAYTAAGTSGQVLTSGGVGAPIWTSVSSLSPTSISNGTSNVSIASANGAITAVTAGATAMTINTSGNVGIGTSTPGVKLDVQGSIRAYSTSGIPISVVQSGQAAGYYPAQLELYRVGAGSTATPDNSTIGEIRFDGLSTGSVYNNMAMIQVTGGTNAAGGMPAYMSFLTGSSGANATERMRIDSSGNVGIGTSLPSTYGLLSVVSSTTTAAITAIGDGQASAFSTYRYTNDTTAPNFAFYKSRGSLASPVTVNSGDIVGTNQFRAYDGAAFQQTAYIRSNVESAPSSGSMPGTLIFATTASGSGFSTERMRIDSSGNVGIGTSSPNASAILDAQSTTKGVRFPNMTTTQKNAVSSPAAGLVVFDTTLAKLCVYSGSAWQTVTSI